MMDEAAAQARAEALADLVVKAHCNQDLSGQRKVTLTDMQSLRNFVTQALLEFGAEEREEAYEAGRAAEREWLIQMARDWGSGRRVDALPASQFDKKYGEWDSLLEAMENSASPAPHEEG